ncbi:MAG: tRNA-specific adenosine-34 deaminase, partial [uncultured Cytophagales bacterium]
ECRPRRRTLHAPCPPGCRRGVCGRRNPGGGRGGVRGHRGSPDPQPDATAQRRDGPRRNAGRHRRGQPPGRQVPFAVHPLRHAGALPDVRRGPVLGAGGPGGVRRPGRKKGLFAHQRQTAAPQNPGDGRRVVRRLRRFAAGIFSEVEKL